MGKGAFAKIANAPMTGGGNNIRDGIYKFLIEGVKLEDQHSGECFIAELRVLESKPSVGALDEKGNQIVPNAPGSSCNLVCNLTKHDAAAGNARKFVIAATAGLGYTPEQVTEEVMAFVCSEKNPLRGVAVHDETYRGVNKGRLNPANRGNPLTLNSWKAVPQTEDDVKKQIAFLESAPVETPAATPSVTTTAPRPVGGVLGGILGQK